MRHGDGLSRTPHHPSDERPVRLALQAPAALAPAAGPAHAAPENPLGAYPREGGPTVLRILLGARLRRLREARGISTEDAGYEIRGSHSKISRMELGRVGFKERDVADLLTLYGVADPEERDPLLRLAREANSPGWWHRYGDVLPDWFETYVGLEGAAALMRTYEVRFVPGLMQTEDYAAAVVRLGHADAPEEEVRQRVGLKMMRQERFSGSSTQMLWAVLDEAALRRPLGGREVMRAQIRHLIDMADRPDVTLQVMPFGAAENAAPGRPFTVLRFAEPGMSDVVFMEYLTSALYLHKPADVETYLRAMNTLCMAAIRPDETVAFLNEVLQEA
ncbi:helix-turn-helix domain-containing protein [Spirillospora sp. CA-255316]